VPGSFGNWKLPELPKSPELKNRLRCLAGTMHKFNLAFLMFEGEELGAVETQPEMLNGIPRRVEAKEPASIQPHEQLGALRIGTLRNHAQVGQ